MKQGKEHKAQLHKATLILRGLGVCVHIAHCLFYSLLQWVCISSTITSTGTHGSRTDTLSTHSLLSSTSGCPVVKTVINFLKGLEAHNHMWTSYKVTTNKSAIFVVTIYVDSIR